MNGNDALWMKKFFFSLWKEGNFFHSNSKSNIFNAHIKWSVNKKIISYLTFISYFYYIQNG